MFPFISIFAFSTAVLGGRRRRNRMVAGFTTCATSAYHH